MLMKTFTRPLGLVKWLSNEVVLAFGNRDDRKTLLFTDLK